ncbi:RidA family protein [Burkholderia glumae]|nr:RidA family protein [Burkholderia glumae]MCQ0032879.1 RidA family protein [Burkholderia glumae]MCQ0039389.1 RidA family protein [Burkholderia glumae]
MADPEARSGRCHVGECGRVRRGEETKSALPRPSIPRSNYQARRCAGISAELGWDAQEKLAGERYADQAIQALKNIVAVLAEAGAKPEHLVRLTWYVADREAYFAEAKEVGRAYRELIGHFPPMSAFQVAALMVEGAKVQIEATAVIPD